LALQLTDALAKYVNIDGNCILTFPGSDTGLETLCRAYLEPGDTVVALCPTYENLFVYVAQTGAQLIKLNLPPPFTIDFKTIENTIVEIGVVKALYLVSPNNPCGYVIPTECIKSLAERFPDTMIIVDEAYVEFADIPSTATLVESFPNIVVFRTFSKGFGLAGLRLGYMCASLPVINTVNKIRNGKNITMIAQRLGMHALRNIGNINAWIDEVKRSRNYFESWCIANNILHYPSQGNFVLIEVRSPNELCSRLKAQGIYVRSRHAMLPGCVRVTIGSKKDVDRLISAIDSMRELL
jgi:histidinol-phosphate aminotransferase